MSPSQARPLIAVLGAVLLTAATYLGLTEGLQRLFATEAPVTAEGRGYLPETVFDPPETVRTTEDFGPVGPVSVVFADGAAPQQRGARWIAVSQQDGDYRALSAPHLPPAAPGAVVVSPDGAWLAWAHGGGAVLYDATRDEPLELTEGLEDVRGVGPFSPDGRHLLAYDGRLLVLQVPTGEVVGTLTDVSQRQARQAVWTPDGSALSYVDGRMLVTRSWSDGATTRSVAPIAPTATLAWQPEGEQVAASRRTRFGNVVDVFEPGPDGDLLRTATVRPEAHSMQRFLGYSDQDSVMLLGLSLDTGALPKAYRAPVDGRSGPTDVMRLPAQSRAAATVQVATAPLRNGSQSFAEPDWPVSDAAKLVASVLTGFFVLGVYLTRRRA